MANASHYRYLLQNRVSSEIRSLKDFDAIINMIVDSDNTEHLMRLLANYTEYSDCAYM